MEPIKEGELIRAGKWTIPVLYADNHLLYVRKPYNMPVQADSSGDTDLLSACKEYIGMRMQKPGNVYLGMVHRLDRPVGGTIVFARTSKAAARLSEAFRKHSLEKIYLAVGQGECRQKLVLHDYLRKDEKTGLVKISDGDQPDAKEAKLVAEPLSSAQGYTLFRVFLETGRQHQIRVQMCGAGYPLYGDARYGSGKPGEQIALWAYSLILEHPTLKKRLNVSSFPPDEGIWRAFTEKLEYLKQE